MNNPPAFPSNTTINVPEGHYFTQPAPQDGMTLRDYFAAQALNALITEGLRLDHKSWAATAVHAYIIADEMLKEREL